MVVVVVMVEVAAVVVAAVIVYGAEIDDDSDGEWRSWLVAAVLEVDVGSETDDGNDGGQFQCRSTLYCHDLRQ